VPADIDYTNEINMILSRMDFGLMEVTDKLDLIIKLLAFLVASEKSITEGARLLKMAGLDNQTIASVLNTTEGTVRVVTSNTRAKPFRPDFDAARGILSGRVASNPRTKRFRTKLVPRKG
jgi:hypothetical protein